ncbi:MAG: hypothetical protein K0S23_117 [Fluviicola sp.]|jgi:hypothetical protein|uniref:T9SS type A sorting domain-containing protein n=1 Tax=Fluviicola sp. TaxID=1917219 RepID=UPI0026116861|nr:T9SS type A sorting domain-containing protein [Fluviicola sp.]MDF3025810.1 hypothetical protein [Fluviicola sp.]
MKNVGIQHACSEDWNKMTPTEKGAFCQKCAKQVYDFTTKSTNEIKHTLLELKGQEVCGRMTLTQERLLNREFEAWIKENKTNFQRLFITALLIVFGLSLFSCEDERDQRRIGDAQAALSRAIEVKLVPDKDVLVETKPDFIPAVIAPMEIMYPDVTPEIYDMVSIEEELEEVEISEDREYYVTSGVMVTHNVYYDYLEETVPEVELDENGVPYPTEFKALVFPNPAVESTTLEVQVPEKERMDIKLYDTSGKFIRDIHSGKLSRGTIRQMIELNDLTSGLYLIIIQSKNFKETVRIIKN